MVGGAYDAEVYQALMASVSSGLVIHGADGNVREANQAFADMLGYTLPEALQLHAAQVVHPDDRPTRDRDAAELLSGAAPSLATERRLLHKDGSTIWARVRKASVRHGDEIVVMVVIDDWTTERAHIRALEHAAYRDELTGLLNRAGVRRALQDAEPVDTLVMMVDVDNLKLVNDAHGHAGGDLLLETIGQSLTLFAPSGSVVGRLSGDEFVILVPSQGTDIDGLYTDCIRRCVQAALVMPNGDEVIPSVSVGTAILVPQGRFEDALHEADTDMYDDKRSRRKLRPSLSEVLPTIQRRVNRDIRNSLWRLLD